MSDRNEKKETLHQRAKERREVIKADYEEMRSDRRKARPAGLVFFEEHEKPRQYVIFSRAEVRGQCPMEIFTPSSL